MFFSIFFFDSLNTWFNVSVVSCMALLNNWVLLFTTWLKFSWAKFSFLSCVDIIHTKPMCYINIGNKWCVLPESKFDNYQNLESVRQLTLHFQDISIFPLYI